MCHKLIFSMLSYCRFWWGSSCRSCSSCDIAYSDPYPPKLRQNPMRSLCVKFQPSSSPPSDRFWWGVLLLLVLLLVLLVTGVKQSQLLVLRLSLEFDNSCSQGCPNRFCMGLGDMPPPPS